MSAPPSILTPPPPPPPPPPRTRTPAPTRPPTTGNGQATVWYTSPVAQAAAQRMAASGTVGDPACSMSALGDPDPQLVPHVSRIGIGTYQGYWCLIW
ncbi:hypothetical protein JCM4814A_50940 [Streptomyces phaeofaciens JCM 4814]|uniref:Uncharacterized protein n=1 Tax=Streptomyces phaeofaciens TaxID=68254 RepID=A0A918M0Y1_9ACTN|nr:hypothetical protein GCM10010226_78080 [Streptomyces phaeofaciens]